jgi:type II secretory pathway pseudopilin PulG
LGKRTGFILLEILLGLLFLGLIAIAGLPAMTFARTSINKASTKSGMIYLCELAAERLKTDQPEVLEYLYQLDETNECIYVDPDIDQNQYTCTLKKLEHTEKYFEIMVILTSLQYDDMEVQLEISRYYEGVLPD